MAATLLSRPAVAAEAAPAAAPTQHPQIAGTLAQYRGQVVLIDFWASWCAACLESLPRLNALHGELAGRGFTVLAINVDEDRRRADAFLKRRPVGYPVVYDPAGTWPESFAVKGMPAAFVLDREGAVRQAWHGYHERDLDDMRSAVEALIGGEPK